MTRRALIACCLAAAALAGGCSRGPDEAALRAQIQAEINKGFKADLVELAALKRQGSAPLPAAQSGARRIIVYYNATLRLREGYDFNNWEALSPGSLAQVLGATERGISGVKAGENRPGDLLYVYGTSTYERSGDAWRPVTLTRRDVSPAPAEPGNAAPTPQAKRALDQLVSMFDIPPPGVDQRDQLIISEELDRAIREIARRRARLQQVIALAGGPAGGEYARLAEAITASIARTNPRVRLRTVETHGSVENALLLGRGESDYALIQSDVAALAATGAGPFAGGAPLARLAALGTLYPEPVQVVVAAQSGIRNVAGLRGKRVDLGAANSGTRLNAIATLQAHGLATKDLAAAREEGMQAAIVRLRAGELDAFFTTIGAPAHDLQRLATEHPVRILSLDASAIERLLASQPSLVKLTLPANTYPGQAEPIATVAASALLVGTVDAPRDEVTAILQLVYEHTDALVAGSAQGVKISRGTALRGIALPLHPAAAAYFGAPPK